MGTAVIRPPLLALPFLLLSRSRTTAARGARVARSTTRRVQKKEGDGGVERVKRRTRREGDGGVERVKRRTRSGVEVDVELLGRYGSNVPHVPVLLCEVLHAFHSLHLRSFVDCTLGAAGHSSAMIEAHEEMELYVGMDVDPSTHNLARTCIESLLADKGRSLRAYIHAANFKHIKRVLDLDLDLEGGNQSLLGISSGDGDGGSESLLGISSGGVDGILIDLGMSSMQVDCSNRGFSVLQDGPLDMRMDPKADLKAEDILNCWPESEIGRILREYGEESNWRSLEKQIVKARATGGLHSTAQLVQLVRKNTSFSAGGRQGWIKTATRVFQALRIAVNNELETLEEALYSCFDCLAPGGRLAVISFHSLEDRIVKQTFLRLINPDHDDSDDCENSTQVVVGGENEIEEDERRWYKHRVHGRYGTILTKRPITPSTQEEKLNPRCRSAKLRLLHKSSCTP